MTQRIAFIDTRIANYQTLVDQLPPDTQVFIVDANANGLSQLLDALKDFQDLDAIDFFTHGREGTLFLGNSVLNADTLSAYAEQLTALGSHLNENGDILLYGCNLAAGEAGQAFVEQFARLTGANVAASDDLTGAARLGGDWVLEVSSGLIESQPLQVTPFDEVLLANSAPTFALGTGKLTTAIAGPNDTGKSVAIQSDGKIVVGGYTDNGSNYDFGLVRYNPDGSLDNTFDIRCNRQSDWQ